MTVLEAKITNTVTPSAEESVLARESGRRLTALFETQDAAISGAQALSFRIGEGEAEVAEVTLPASAVRLLARLLEEMGDGHAVTLLPADAELSTQEAADLLSVSRPYLVRLLDEKQLPSRKVGRHRRVRLDDVLSYKAREDAARHRVLDELAAQAQELDMGY